MSPDEGHTMAKILQFPGGAAHIDPALAAHDAQAQVEMARAFHAHYLTTVGPRLENIRRILERERDGAITECQALWDIQKITEAL